MSRRLRKSTSLSSGSAGGLTGEADIVVSSERAVIWIDSTPLVKAEQTKLRQVQKKLSVAEDRVRLHKQSDEPEYQKWFNATFAERVADVRELYEKLAELDSVVWKVEREILATGCSALEAYERVMQETTEEAKAERAEAEPDEPSEKTESESSEEVEFERQRADAREDWKPTERATKKADASDETIKAIYRQLVRKLHPDLNPDLSEELRERWFEVQQAYDDRDLSRLEMLLAACEEGTDEGTFIDKIQSLSRLRALIKSVTKKLKTSQRQLTKLKTAPAWEFHKVRKDPRKLAFLERDVKFELRNAEESLESDIRTLEAQIERWKNPPQARRRNRRNWDLQIDY